MARDVSSMTEKNSDCGGKKIARGNNNIKR